MNRIPGLEAEQEGIHILQIFASSLDLNRNDRESEPSYPPDLYRTVNRLNVSLPLGAFGLMEDEAVLFYKLNVLLDLKQDLGWNTQLIDRNIGLLLHIHDVFIDTLEEVATGKLSYDSAISRLRLP
ncbi:YbjN domain-containing protein [Paenibacillus solanacearum]|uniref:YbjN domain-containing protein n=1 Tax=Paenibacillus solanacearum TaxID=2048548 RepID=UPI001C4019B7|nr:YbjN domain-containing protein [Paenibacillus solanacearum]